MKRLIWVPTGRRLWFDLACWLADQGLATPAVWIGDDAHLSAAQDRFPGARIFSLRAMVTGRRQVPEGTSDAELAARVLTSAGWALASEHALKLMDRGDFSDRLTRREREAWLGQLVLWACGLIRDAHPDAMIMAEAPHSTPTYVLYAVADLLDIPVFSFGSWPLLPGLVLRLGIAGPARKAPPSATRRAILPRWEREIDAYLGRFEGDGYDFQPRYMQLQANFDSERRLKYHPLIRSARRWFSLAKPRRARAAWQRFRLKRALAAAVTPMPSSPYVYFALHYEPERTTTPDGGQFHSQLQTLILLRSLVPSDFAIVVKEHPSIFNPFMQGHLGRHPRFYAAIRRIPGLYLLSETASSADLLRGCSAVATITGTVAVEAAALGKRALVFGNAWFLGCPNTTKYTSDFDWRGFVAAPCVQRPALRKWCVDTLHDHVLPGTINPSNERYFAGWYADRAYGEAEFDSVSSALKEALQN